MTTAQMCVVAPLLTEESDSGMEFPATGATDMIRIVNVNVKYSIIVSSTFFLCLRNKLFLCYSGTTGYGTAP
jgi:hypothetical protein